MSVAFRRDCDEEHLEPRFELPIPPGPNLVTAAGLTQIEARVAEFEAKVVAADDEAVRTEAKRDLRYWRARQATARIAPPPPSDRVAFGSRVTFRLRKAVRTLHIVGADEADPRAEKIAFSAPLARALIGAQVGDHVDFADEVEAIEIIDIAMD